MTIIIVTIAVTVMGLETEDHPFVISLLWLSVTWWGSMFKDPAGSYLFRRHLK